MTVFTTLQGRHEALLTRQDALSAGKPDDATSAALLADAQAFMADVVTQSGQVSAPGERDLLRAYLRYWATYVYEHTGVFPKTDLRPVEAGVEVREEAPTPPTPRPEARGLPWWAYALLGVLLLGALALITTFALNRNAAVPTTEQPGVEIPVTAAPPVTRTPVPETALPAVPIDERNAAQVREIARIQAHSGPASALAFDPVQPEVATGAADGEVRIWLVPGLEADRRLVAQRGWVRTVAYAPSTGRAGAPPLFLAGGNEGILRAYDVESLNLFAEYLTSADSGFVLSGQFSPDGGTMVAGYGDGIARIWNVAGGNEQQQVPARRGDDDDRWPSAGGPVNGVAYLRAGVGVALAVSTDRGVQVWSEPYDAPRCVLSTGPATSVAYSPVGDFVLAGTEKGQLVLFYADDCRAAYALDAHQGAVTSVAVSPDGGWILSGGRDGTAKIWTWQGQPLATLQAAAPVEAVAIAPDARFIATTDSLGELILWGVPR